LNGGVLGELLGFSIEAHLRAQLSPGYIFPTPVGAPIRTHVVTKVLRSEHPKFKVGDLIAYKWGAVTKYSILEPKELEEWELLLNPHNIPLSILLGAAGMPGRTAYYGYRLLTDPKALFPAKKGETIYISTAAGPHGSLLIQLFKQLGLKVIGSAGSAEKVSYLKGLGADVAFSYKDESVADVLKREGPIDIYWDNVGGAMLEAAVQNMNKHGRIVICGFTSSYETGKAAPFLSMFDVMYKSLTVHGFFYCEFTEQYEADFQKDFVPRVASGEFRYQERVIDGLENAEQALVDVIQGSNFGKTVVVL
jgi:NADPH-dependent curcumin reductase CurA